MGWSKDKFDIAILTNDIENTYFELIKQNLSLIRKLLNEKRKLHNDKYSTRAKHIQIMDTLGSTAEYLIKLILLKRGFCVNKIEHSKEPIKFSNSFLKKLNKFNKCDLALKSHTNGFRLNQKIYLEAKKDLNRKFKQETANFDSCITCFKKSKKSFYKNYLLYIKPFRITNRKITGSNGKRYLKKYEEITKNNCLDIIRNSRNNYTHVPKMKGEMQGIYWYMYNFLISLAMYELTPNFKYYRLIGDDKIKSLFKKIK